MAGIADVQALYKIRYEPVLRDQLNHLTNVRAELRRVPPSSPATGQFTREPIITGQSGGEGYVPPEGVIPEADSPSVANTDIYIMEWWGSVSVSQRSISAAKDDIGAYVRTQSFHVQDMRKKAMFTAERVACGDGTGKLAVVGVTGSEDGDATVDVGHTKLRIPKYQAARLRKNDRIHFWTTNLSTATQYANPASQSYYKITVLNWNFSATQAEITFDNAFAFAPLTLDGANLQLVKADARTRSGGVTYTNEAYGLDALIDNSDTNRMQPNTVGVDVAPTASSLQNIAAASEPTWAAPVKAAGGDDFSPHLCEDVFSELAAFGANGREGVTFIGINPIQMNIWRKNRFPEQRVVVQRTDAGPAVFPAGGSEMAKNGITRQAVSDIPLIESRMFETDSAYFVCGDAIKYFVLDEFQAWDPNGSGPHKNFSRKTALDQEFFEMCQLATVGRNCSAKVTGLSTTT